jgi:hypothetical protein
MRTLALPLTLALAVAWAGSASAQDKDGFTPLYNGKDLSGWKPFLRASKDSPRPDPKNTWSIVDGEIVCQGKPNGYIATEKEYGNYVLRLKWRFPKGGMPGNSGVLLHVQKEDKVWPTSVEAQLQSGRAGDFWLIMPPEVKLDVDRSRQDPKQARHYFRDPKDEPVEKPIGEWNQYEITCKGGDITLKVNGRTVNQGKNGNLKSGRIGLQSEGSEIHFKDIEIAHIR